MRGIRLIRRVVPSRLRSPLRRAFCVARTPLYLGSAVECPCCDRHFRSFAPGMMDRRANAECPACHAAERHRLLVLYLRDRTTFFTEHLRVLEIAPHASLQRKFRALPSLDYVTGDLESARADAS